jgi:hypothetical protein
MPRGRTQSNVHAVSSNFAYMRRLHNTALATPCDLQLDAIKHIALDGAFAGVKTEFIDLDGDRAGRDAPAVRTPGVFALAAEVDLATGQTTLTPSAPRPRIRAMSTVHPFLQSRSPSPPMRMRAGHASELGGRERAMALLESEDEETIRPARRERLPLFSPANKPFPSSAKAAADQRAEFQAARDDARELERPPSRCGFWGDDDDDDDEPRRRPASAPSRRG